MGDIRPEYSIPDPLDGCIPEFQSSNWFIQFLDDFKENWKRNGRRWNRKIEGVMWGGGGGG